MHITNCVILLLEVMIVIIAPFGKRLQWDNYKISADIIQITKDIIRYIGDN